VVGPPLPSASVVGAMHNSGTVLRANAINPARSNRALNVESTACVVSAKRREPRLDFNRRDASPESFSKNGMPANGPLGFQRVINSRVASYSGRQIALCLAPTCCERRIAHSMSSPCVTSPRCSNRASSTASHCTYSPSVISAIAPHHAPLRRSGMTNEQAFARGHSPKPNGLKKKPSGQYDTDKLSALLTKIC
jgi:hypothetical protein